MTTTAQRPSPAPGQDILGGNVPEMTWTHGDDLCDCTFQRIGEWTNPYLARTMRVRMCCIWAEMYKQFPQFVQEIPAYYNENADQFEPKPQKWNAEDADMPRALWHRQMAIEMGMPLGTIRRMLEGKTPPKAVQGTGVKVKAKGKVAA